MTHNVTLHLVNNLVYPADFTANGSVVARVDALSTSDKTIPVGGSLAVSFTMIQPVLAGRSLGDPINAAYDAIPNPTGTITFTAKSQLSNATYFAPRMNNQTGDGPVIGRKHGAYR